MSDAVGLESIRDCLRAGLPSPMATCAPDGTPHISYILQVQYLDRERVATSRQPFNQALADLDACPYAQALVVRPVTAEEFRLDLRYLHTVTEGEAFEAMRANLDAIASQTGHGPGVPAARAWTCTACCAARRVRRGSRRAGARRAPRSARAAGAVRAPPRAARRATRRRRTR